MGGVIGGLLGGGGGSPPPVIPAPPPRVEDAALPSQTRKEIRPAGTGAAGATDENAKRRFAAGFAQNIKTGALGVAGNAQTQKSKLGQ